VACWSTKAAISRKRVKIDEKLLWTAYVNSARLFRTVPSSTPYGLPFRKIGVRNPNPKLQSLLSQEATDCKVGRYLYSVHPNISPLKFGEKGAWAYLARDFPNFLSTPIISGIGKATNFKL